MELFLKQEKKTMSKDGQVIEYTQTYLVCVNNGIEVYSIAIKGIYENDKARLIAIAPLCKFRG